MKPEQLEELVRYSDEQSGLPEAELTPEVGLENLLQKIAVNRQG